MQAVSTKSGSGEAIRWPVLMNFPAHQLQSLVGNHQIYAYRPPSIHDQAGRRRATGQEFSQPLNVRTKIKAFGTVCRVEEKQSFKHSAAADNPDQQPDRPSKEKSTHQKNKLSQILVHHFLLFTFLDRNECVGRMG